MSVFRRLSSILVILAVAAYTLALITGLISTAHRIDAIDLALIAAASGIVVVMVNPDLLRQIKLVELWNIRLELRRPQESVQSDQRDALDEVRIIMSILLPNPSASTC